MTFKKNHKVNEKHGQYGTPIHNAWKSMRTRARKEEVTVCREWEGFQIFYEDVKDTFQKGLRLARIDTALPYSKDNYEWITASEQSKRRWSQTGKYKRNKEI